MKLRKAGEKNLVPKNRRCRRRIRRAEPEPNRRERIKGYRQILGQIALPILDAFQPNIENSRKQEFVNWHIKHIGEIYYPNSKAFASIIPGQSGIKINRYRHRTRKSATASEIGHELIHVIDIEHHSVVANAFSAYAQSIPALQRFYKGQGMGTIPQSVEKNLDALEKQIKDKTQRLEVGRSKEKRVRKNAEDLGEQAAAIETVSGKPGAGLFFIKMVCEGIPWREAQKKLLEEEVPELKKWQAKHAEHWMKAPEKK